MHNFFSLHFTNLQITTRRMAYFSPASIIYPISLNGFIWLCVKSILFIKKFVIPLLLSFIFLNHASRKLTLFYLRFTFYCSQWLLDKSFYLKTVLLFTFFPRLCLCSHLPSSFLFFGLFILILYYDKTFVLLRLN